MVRIIEDEKNDLINKYFRLDQKINRDLQLLNKVKEHYRSKSYHTRTEAAGGIDVRTRAFRIEDEVCSYLDHVAVIEKRMNKKERKKYYFIDYLNKLPPVERKYLYDRFVHHSNVIVNEKIEQATIEEIYEIEDAVCYLNGDMPEKWLRAENTTELGFNELLEVLDL